ncbi:MAG: PAS domain-containing protein, partial [Chloroflexota bacterium]
GIPVPTYTWQRKAGDFVLIEYNDAAQATDQGNLAELVGQTAGAIFKDRPQVIQDFARCYAEKTSVDREAPYQLLSTGETRHFVTTYNFIQPDLVLVHIQDITEYKRIEAELRTQHPGFSEHIVEPAKVVEANSATEVTDLVNGAKPKNGHALGSDEDQSVAESLEQEINKRRVVEAALADSEQRLKEVAGNIDERLREQYRSIPIPTYTWQYIAGEFVLIDFNNAAAESMGKIVEFFGKSAGEIFRDRPQVLEDFDTCYRKKETIIREAPYDLVTTGETRFFVTSYVFTEPNLIIVHIHDITEYKAIEAELEEVQAQLVVTQWELSWVKEKVAREEAHVGNGSAPVDPDEQTWLDYKLQFDDVDAVPQAMAQPQYNGIPIATYYWQKLSDDTLRLVNYNEAAEKATQGSIQSFVGNAANEIFKDRPQVLADFERCYSEEITVTREAPYQMITTGKTKFFVTTYEFVPPDQVVVYIQDITRYKKWEADLEYSSGQMELICRFSPNQTLTFVNDAYCWYFSETREKLLGAHPPCILEEDQDLLKEHLANLSVEHPASTVEYRVQRSDEDIRWQQWVNRAIFDHDGNLVEIQSIGRDITQRKQE